MTSLAKTNPVHSKVVELRYFAGLTIKETTPVLELSHATVERSWKSRALGWVSELRADDE